MSFVRPDYDPPPEQVMAYYASGACYNLFCPPPGIDGATAYRQVFCGCISIWGHAIALCLLLGMCTAS